MIDLSRLIQSAEGGDAIGAIARRFGLTPEQAQSAVNALLPAIQMGLQKATRTGAAGSILSQMANPAQGTGEADVASMGSILGSLFGGHGGTAGVARQAAAQSGVSASVIQAMLPTLVSLVLGGLLKGAQNGAFGGAIGSILSSVLAGAGGARGPAAPSEGGLGGLLGSLLGNLLGGGNAQAPGAERSGDAPPAGREPDRPATPASILDELSAMVHSGTPPAPDHEDRLAAIIGR